MPRDLANPTRDLFDVAVKGHTLRVTCRCRHSAVFDPHELWWYFQRRGRDPWLRDLPRKFFCTRCRWAGRRRSIPQIDLSKEKPTIRMILPPDHMWKHEMRRRR